MPDWVPSVQAIHHGDDHRTQVNTLLGRRGVEPPDLAGWVYGDLPAEPGGIGEGAAALLPRFLGHHLWAVDQLMRWYVRLPDEARELGVPGTYGSIHATLKHLAFGDRQYLGWLEARHWDSYLEVERDFDRRVGSEDGWSPAWAIVLQAIHHGNDHRTHVGTTALAHALESPDVDVWSYAVAEGAYSEEAG